MTNHAPAWVICSRLSDGRRSFYKGRGTITFTCLASEAKRYKTPGGAERMLHKLKKEGCSYVDQATIGLL